MLIGGVALGGVVVSGCGRDQRAVGELLFDETPAPSRFPLGLSSGDVRYDSAVLWTRHLGDGPLALNVYELRDDGGEAWIVERRPVQRADGGFVHIEATGLRPGAQYRFEFEEAPGAEAQRVEGHFRTAPPPRGLERMIFTASACARNGGDFGALSQAAARSADLHVLLGDTVYADGARSLDEYWEKWRENLGTPAYRALRAERSVLATWDDHEVKNDWSGDEMDAELRRNGTAAFFEHLPLRRIQDAPDRLWRSVRWGDTAEFFVIDGRSERKPDTRETADAEYLSRAQFDWLKAALKASTARFKVLVNSVPITRFPGPFRAWTHDQWVGYAAQREALLAFIEEEPISGAFFVSGDFHMASFGAVSPDGPGQKTVEILTGAVATRSANPLWNECRAPQFAFATITENTASIALDPFTGEATVTWYDGAGRELYRRAFWP